VIDPAEANETYKAASAIAAFDAIQVAFAALVKKGIRGRSFGGLEVDNELEFSTLFDRQIGYLRFLLLTPIYFAALFGSTTTVAVMRGCSEQKYW